VGFEHPKKQQKLLSVLGTRGQVAKIESTGLI